MMKQMIRLLICCLGILVFLVPPIHAGTYILGAKYWYTYWDSAILDWFEEDIASSFQANRQRLTANKDSGKGFLTGPLIGYQTSDGKWSFSFAPMIFSSFDQDWTGNSGAMLLNGRVDLERKDFDFAVGYKLSRYLKVYSGYKYQDMKMDFTLSYDTVTMGTQNYYYDVRSSVHIPTLGLGGVYKVSENVVTGLQIGGLYAIPELTISESGQERENIKPWADFGYTIEGNLTYQPQPSILLQLGYRYQVFQMEARGPGRTVIIKSYDVTQGWTLSALYVF